MAGTLRSRIDAALRDLRGAELAGGCIRLLNTLGYQSNRRVELAPNTPENFRDTFGGGRTLNEEQARFGEWLSADFLMQLTDSELGSSGQLGLLVEDNTWNQGIYQSFAVLAIRLAGDAYSRTALAAITRAVNRLFAMPTPIFFRYGDKVTLAIILRRPGKRDASKDVLEKVTLIKDIRLDAPHAAHVRILEELALENLRSGQSVSNFDELQDAWAATLDISALNKRFYEELSHWYFWAVREVKYPRSGQDDEETRNAVNVIRLITRMIFVWFLKEKGLVPDDLFRRETMARLLHDLSDEGDTYYKAILQNLFFATLNTEMNTAEHPTNRIFRSTAEARGYNKHYGVHSVYRYEEAFTDRDAALGLFANIPFLNGGLFECLDKEVLRDGKRRMALVDGFSDRPDNPLRIPNVLFFGDERPVDLNDVYGTKNKTYKARGLLGVLSRYKFTVEENTPIDEEVALDPELLGKVFENLLAAYNPETRTTARKQTGSFYTPREIVDYMVDEALIAYLDTALARDLPGAKGDTNRRLRQLFAYTDQPHEFAPDEATALIHAIDTAKILDPACGSGAFPMGILHKLVFILRKLDPNNVGWKRQQLERARRDRERAEEMEDEVNRRNALREIEERIQEIERSFTEQNHELDYTRKLYLIENCIYGVDIQPIAVQIAKLRFFISLVADQRIDDAKPNRAVRALPNLETKFVAANSLLSIARPEAKAPTPAPAVSDEAQRVEKELLDIFRQYLKVTRPETKEKALAHGREACAELNALLAQHPGFTPLDADWLFPTLASVDALRALLPGAEAPEQEVAVKLRNPEIDRLEGELRRVRQRHFTARTAATKKKCREEDEALRRRIRELLERDGWEHEATQRLAGWNPYDQNAHADFFDPEWMFGVTSGFDVVIGNPPYLESRNPAFSDAMKDSLQEAVARRWHLLKRRVPEFIPRGSDLLVYFLERSITLIDASGLVVLLTQNAWLDTEYGAKAQSFLLAHTTVTLVVDSGFKHFASGEGPNINTVITEFVGMKPNPSMSLTFARFRDRLEPGLLAKCDHSAEATPGNLEFRRYEYGDGVLRKTKWGMLLSLDPVALDLIAVLDKKAQRFGEVADDLDVGQGLNLVKDFLIPRGTLEQVSPLAAIPILSADDGAPFFVSTTSHVLADSRVLSAAELRQIKALGYKPFRRGSTTKDPPVLILPRGIGRHFCGLNLVSAYSASFVDIYMKGSLSRDVNRVYALWTVLNSSVTWLLREIAGRKNLGGGMLKAEAADLRDLPLYLELPMEAQVREIASQISSRQALAPLAELETAEHQAIDKIVFDALGLGDAARDAILRSLSSRIAERLHKART